VPRTVAFAGAALLATLIAVLAVFGLSRPEQVLFAAATDGNTALVEKLLRQGALPDYRGDHENTPLHAAAVQGHEGVVEVLLKHGAATEARNEFGLTPLHCAILHRRFLVADMLLRGGADADACVEDARPGFDGGPSAKHLNAPIHIAAELSDAAMIELLVGSGASVDAKNAHGLTALHRATLRNDVRAVRALLKHGADPRIESSVGRSPMDHAAIDVLKRRIYEMMQDAVAQRQRPVH
jgi:ankyrin repeat protein